MTKNTFLYLVFALFSATYAVADPVSDRLDALEKTIQSMQTDSIARNEKVASALSTIEQIRQDYSSVQGTLESNSHLLQEQQAEISRLKRDFSERLSAIEEQLEVYNQQIIKAVSKVLPQAANETENYQKSLDFVHNGDFLTAVSSLKTFLKTYPKSDLADNAQYWIGECYYAMRDYQKAIKEFQTVVDKYPKSDKVPGSVLKQGFSFAEIDLPEEAKMFLNKVIKDFPGSDESVRAREKLDKINAPKDIVPLPSTINSSDSIPLAPGVKKGGNQEEPLPPRQSDKGL